MAWTKIRSVLAKIVIIPLVILAAVQVVQGQDTALMKAARDEGKVVFYSSSNIAEMKPLVDAFAAKYPFMKPELYRASSEGLQNRILAENRAGASSFDVVQTNLPELEYLISKNLIGKYKSPERRFYSKLNKDSDGYWTNLHSSYYVLGYNPELVPKGSIPRDWNDVLDPRWKGNFGMDPEDYAWYGAMVEYMGREAGRKFMRDFAKQEPVFRKGHTLLAQLLSAGEFHLALVYAHRVESMKRKGAPIEWVKTTKPIIAEMRMVGMSAKTKHPNASRLFTDFVLSREGQQVLRGFGRVVARNDLKPLVPALEPSKLDLYPVSRSVSGRLNSLVNEVREVFGMK